MGAFGQIAQACVSCCMICLLLSTYLHLLKLHVFPETQPTHGSPLHFILTATLQSRFTSESSMPSGHPVSCMARGPFKAGSLQPWPDTLTTNSPWLSHCLHAVSFQHGVDSPSLLLSPQHMARELQIASPQSMAKADQAGNLLAIQNHPLNSL